MLKFIQTPSYGRLLTLSSDVNPCSSRRCVTLCGVLASGYIVHKSDPSAGDKQKCYLWPFQLYLID